ncbi:MAG: helix-turn-helix domain-containing protein [Eubacteriales bacterium]|jgi:DNA-binding XRE family transcriptional regulator
MTILPLKDFDAADIKRIRNSIGATQVAFAGILGVSKKAVEAWESGRNKPDGPSRRLIAVIEEDPFFPSKYGLVLDMHEFNEETKAALQEFLDGERGDTLDSMKNAMESVR